MIEVDSLIVPNTGYLTFNWRLSFWRRLQMLFGFPICVEFQSTDSATKVSLGLYRWKPDLTITFNK